MQRYMNKMLFECNVIWTKCYLNETLYEQDVIQMYEQRVI